MTPNVTEVEIIPVAGYDSMLLNLSGAHAPVFTRTVVVMHDESGACGISEIPCSESILRLLDDSKGKLIGKSIGDIKSILGALWREYGHLDTQGRGLQTFDTRTTVHAITAYEAALFDLLGQHLSLPLCHLIGGGQVRDTVHFLGYLFFVADKKQTDLFYRDGASSGDKWFRLRDKPAQTPDEIVEHAVACQEKYGFKDFKLKGGVFSPEHEVTCVRALAERFPEARITLDPNGCWSLQEALEVAEQLRGVVSYLEDPCGAQAGYSGREIMAEFRRASGIPTATNMIATDRRQMAHALSLRAVDIPLADPHFWGIEGACYVASLCADHGLVWGSHSNNHFDISLAIVSHVAAAAQSEITAIDTHWIWQDGQRLSKSPPEIREGGIQLPKRPGLGLEIDREALDEANKLFRQWDSAGRDDSTAMQFLIDDWHFDPKRPCMIR